MPLVALIEVKIRFISSNTVVLTSVNLLTLLVLLLLIGAVYDLMRLLIYLHCLVDSLLVNFHTSLMLVRYRYWVLRLSSAINTTLIAYVLTRSIIGKRLLINSINLWAFNKILRNMF